MEGYTVCHGCEVTGLSSLHSLKGLALSRGHHPGGHRQSSRHVPGVELGGDRGLGGLGYRLVVGGGRLGEAGGLARSAGTVAVI